MENQLPKRKKVFVALSGGVDSSVSAALLTRAGYDVTGVFIRVWYGDTELTQKSERRIDAEQRAWLEFNLSSCTAADDRLDAMRVCAKLGIPFVELNLEKAYKKEVVDYMILEYKAGRTPNPDVMCNRFIKFGKFYDWAIAHEADFIATGHYTRIRSVKDKRLRIKDFDLLAGSDPRKDQSYFLWQIRGEQLPRILFPVGGMRKTEVRKLAKKFGLITAEKKDSQGLCFIGKVDMKNFLKRFITEKSGSILDEEGRVIGKHTGVFFYTIGQRTPVAIGRLKKVSGPYYVVAKNIQRNTLTVSARSPSGELEGIATEVEIKDCNWISKPIEGMVYAARTRYREKLRRVTLLMRGARVIIRFETPVIAAPGQSLVLYDGEICLGGGIIC